MPERILWRELKQLKAQGHHFRRQAPIGPYFADFLCHGARLAVEVDGHLHGTDAAMKRDAQRTRRFEEDGYRVLRVTNSDVVTNLDGVMETIMSALGAAPPPPTPPHKREGSETE